MIAGRFIHPLFVVLGVLAVGPAAGAAAQPGAAPGSPIERASLESFPVTFEANEGQADRRVELLARGPGYELLLARREAVLGLHSASGIDWLHLRFVGASPKAKVVGRGELRGRSNYLLGSDPTLWHRNIANYGAAAYRDLYPRIDAVFHGTFSTMPARARSDERLELDFELAAGADPRLVQLAVEGAKDVRILSSGEVRLELESGQRVALGRPHVYQDFGGLRREVRAAYVLRSEHRLAFAIGPYDPSHRLIVDPTLQYSTYVAGGQVAGVAVDHAGHVYVVGTTRGGIATFPSNAYQSACAACSSFSGSAFVAKYDTTQSGAASLIYSTYLGPAASGAAGQLGSAAGSAIAVDSNGDAYLTGYVEGTAGSSYFPTTAQSWMSMMPGLHDAFVSELDPTGSTLLASTYLGGNNGGLSSSNADQGTGIALDGSGNVYITGLTNSAGLATANAPQAAPHNGSFNGTPFAAKLDSTLSHLGYFTYLGGNDNISGISDTANAIAADTAGDAYVVGGTYAGACNYGACSGGSGFPTPAAAGFQPTPGGTNESGYLAKINPSGTQVLYLTFLGGGSDDSGGTEIRAVALDSAGNAYLTGGTSSKSLPTTGSVVGPQQTVCQTNSSTSAVGCPTSFVGGVNPSANGAGSLLFLTYLGGVRSSGGSATSGSAIALDSSADLFVAGTTSATDMPLPGTVNSANGLEPSSTLPCAALLPECISPFLVELAPGATKVLYSGYLAGTGGSQFEQDSVAGMALDAQGDVFLSGTEATNDFPVTTSGYDQTPPSASSSYLAMISGTASSGGSPSVATYTLDGLPPTLGGLGYLFSASAPATTSVNVPVVLTNSGGSPFTLSSLSLFGTDSPPWTLTGLSCQGAAVPLPISTNAPVSLGPGQSCTIQLSFAPTLAQPGQVEGLEIVDTASNTNANGPGPGSTSGQNVLLDGTGTAAPPPSFASYSIDGTALVQANYLQPATTLVSDLGSSAATELVLTNTGGVSMTVSSVSLSGSSTSPSPWAITGGTCPSGSPLPAPVTLAPQASCTVDVQFAPISATTPQDVLMTVLDSASASNLVESAANVGQAFVLQGTVGQPYADYSTAQVKFGNVTINTPQTQNVTVTNTGTGPLGISNIKIAVSLKDLGTYSYWKLLSDCNVGSSGGGASLYPLTIAPGASCDFTFQLDPTAPASALVALVSFFDNAAQSNLPSTLNGSYIQQVKLYGTAVLPLTGFASSLTFTPESLSFTSTAAKQSLPITVQNTGTDPVVIYSVVPEGAYAFTLPQSGCVGPNGTPLALPVTLASEEACTFTIQYDPSVTGAPASYGGGGTVALFTDNAYRTNVGSNFGPAGITQGINLMEPGQTQPVVPCGDSQGIRVSPYAMEPHPDGSWSQAIGIASTLSGNDLPQYTWVVLEGATVGPTTANGTTPTDPALASACGDLPGSPTVLATTYGVTGYGAIVGLPSATLNLNFPAGAEPSYQQAKGANGGGAP